MDGLPGITAEDMYVSFMAGLDGSGGRLDPEENDYEFIRANQVVFDRRYIGGNEGLGEGANGDYKHLRELYQDTARRIVLMAGAQTGKSLWLMVHLARMALLEWGGQIGYYLPTEDLGDKFSDTRFRPFLKWTPALSALLGAKIRTDAGDEMNGRDAIRSMTLGATNIHFLTISGTTSTEGMPLIGTFFDEVRRMAIGDIERAQMRYANQPRDRVIDVKVSTARYPERDIHGFYLRGDQRKFHTECRCPEGVVLTDTFPSCIEDLRHATPKRLAEVAHAYSTAGVPLYGVRGKMIGLPAAAFVCPKCGEILVDPRDGWWEAHGVETGIHSYQMSRMLTVESPAPVILDAFEHATDQQEFWNSWIGVPFVDREKMPLTLEDVDACRNHDLAWGVHMAEADRRKRVTNCAMGIDQQAGWATAVVKQMQPNGRARVIHVEVLENIDEARGFWHRAGQLMHLFDVRCCVADEGPDTTGSLNFAHAFPGRVFLGRYSLGEKAKGAIQWEDQRLAKDKKQRGDSSDQRHLVSMDRTRVIHWSLMRWKKRLCEIPNPNTLIQTLPVDSKGDLMFSAHLRAGVRSPARPALRLRQELVGWVFRDVFEDDPEATPSARAKMEVKVRRGAKRLVAESLGDHNDLSMADVYCNVALERIGRPAGIRGIE